LAQYPDSSAPRPKLGAYVRTSVVSPYVVIYEHLEDDDVVMPRRTMLETKHYLVRLRK
jgi:hypothetical protein